jgi:hypothetical protein
MNATTKNTTAALILQTALAFAVLCAFALLPGCATQPRQNWQAYQWSPPSSSYSSAASSSGSRSNIADLLILDMYVNQPIYGYGFRQQAPFVPMPITWGNTGYRHW